MKNQLILFGAIIVALSVMFTSLCMAGDLFTDYSLLKGNGEIASIEVNKKYSGPDVRFRVFVRQYGTSDGMPIDHKEIYVSVKDLETRKEQAQEQITEIQAKITELDKMIIDFKALEPK